MNMRPNFMLQTLCILSESDPLLLVQLYMLLFSCHDRTREIYTYVIYT